MWGSECQWHLQGVIGSCCPLAQQPRKRKRGPWPLLPVSICGFALASLNLTMQRMLQIFWMSPCSILVTHSSPTIPTIQRSLSLYTINTIIPWFNLWAMLIILSPRFPWHGVSLIREDITMKAIDRERERRSNNIITVSVGIRVVRHVRLRMRRYKHFVVAWAWTSYAGRCGPKAPQALASPQTVCSDAAQGMEAEIRVDCSDWNLCWRCWRLDSIT